MTYLILCTTAIHSNDNAHSTEVASSEQCCEPECGKGLTHFAEE